MDDSEYLAPAYGSGAFPDPDISYGSGFYTRQDFIEILQYAAERHIEVIPEVNMPGHARAAIKAMEYRYKKLMEEGKKGYPLGRFGQPEEVAEACLFLASDAEGLESLSPDHWAVIHYIRDFYLEHGLAPLIRKICKNTGLKLKTIYGLFPSGPAKGACKVAGLPKPTGCV